MAHFPEHTPFDAAARTKLLNERFPFDAGAFGGIRRFFSGVNPNVISSLRKEQSGLLDKQAKSQSEIALLDRFQAAIQAGTDQGLPLNTSVLQAITKDPTLLTALPIQTLKTFLENIKSQAGTLERGQRGTVFDPTAAPGKQLTTGIESEPRAAVAVPAGSQFTGPTGEKLGSQVPFKEPPDPDILRLIQAAEEAFAAGKDDLGRKINEQVILQSADKVVKNAKGLADARKKSAEAAANNDPGGVEFWNTQAAAIAKGIENDSNNMAALMAGIIARNTPQVPGAAPRPGAKLETGPLSEVPLAPGGQPTSGALTLDAFAKLPPNDRAILLLPLDQVTPEQVTSMTPEGQAFHRARTPQQGVPGTPGAKLNAPTINVRPPPGTTPPTAR